MEEIKNNIYYPTGYFINKSDVFIFDLFYKQNKIYLVSPELCVNTIDISNIIFSIDGKQIDPIIMIKNNIKEPIIVCIYDYKSNDLIINVNIIYNEINIEYALKNIKSMNKQTYFLGLTTLLKDDYKCFTPFYIYYKEQGVSHFFIYYNGIVTNEIRDYFDYDDVTLIEWNYEYWNKHFKSGTSHVAQMGQMHHALYKFGKDLSEYMIFCDLDEYLYIPDYTLNEYIKLNPACDVFGFCNRWSDISDNNIPEKIPHIINMSDKLKYKDRSKNIYKTSSVELLNIHFPFKCKQQKPFYITDLDMFHFYKWSGKKRTFLTNDRFVFQNKNKK